MIDIDSQDEIWEIIKTESDNNPKAVGIRMSRNFSLDSAFTCGIDYAETDIAIVMTSGLQDPAEAIPLLLRKYEEGYDQILAKITKRASVPFSRRIFSKLFYKLSRSARPLK
jgi:glycosyltransferase involved in cell wall biosynthesis